MRPKATTPPTWLDETTLRQLRTMRAQGLARRRDVQAIAAEIRDALWGRYPALPLTAIDDAARCVAGDRLRNPTQRPARLPIQPVGEQRQPRHHGGGCGGHRHALTETSS